MRRLWPLFALISAIVSAARVMETVPVTAQQNGAAVREEHHFVVAGVDEVWQLVWDSVPVNRCGLEDLASAMTCPCSGWAYGQSGKAWLVRRRNGRVVERLSLGLLFRIADFDGPDLPNGDAILPRWPEQAGDRGRVDDVALSGEIARRPAPAIMQMADYDRDGAATEFLLQVATLPCGKRQFVAVGVTKRNPRLHAWTTRDHPEKPLVMPEAAWQALARTTGPTVVPTLACGDHASERRTELLVSAANGDIHVRNRSFSCPDAGGREVLLEDTTW